MARDVGDGPAVPGGTPPDHDRNRSAAKAGFVWEYGNGNARTAQMEKGTPIPVVITAFQDRSFTFEMKLPPVSYFLKRASGIQSGSKTAGRGFAGKITKAQIQEIAGKKLPDLNCASVEAAARMIEGSARSMGLEVVE